MKIIIDAGHGGKDSGGGSNDIWLEKDITLKISLYQYNRLRELGINVEMTRKEDITLSPNERTKKVRDSGAIICISNHINSFSQSTAEGAETIYSIYRDGKLANLILNELKTEGASIRRAFYKALPNNPKRDYYYMHRETGSVETVIVEYGFATNPNDVRKIKENWKEYGEAVIRALCNYTDYPYTDEIEDDQPNYKELYEDCLRENKSLKERIEELKKE